MDYNFLSSGLQLTTQKIKSWPEKQGNLVTAPLPAATRIADDVQRENNGYLRWIPGGSLSVLPAEFLPYSTSGVHCP